MSNRIGTRAAVAAGAAVMLVTACGGSGGDGSAEEFCDVLRAAEADEGDGEASFDDIRELAATAPSELRADMDTMVEAFEQIESLDEDDPDGFGAVAEVLFSTDFVEAAERLERFGVDECGLEPTGAP